MKKAISIIEVLVAVMLITTVIAAVLQMKNNNLFFLDKFSQSALLNSYVSYTVVQPPNSKRDTKIYLDKQVDFNDDDIRKKLKQIKISIKDTEEKDIGIPKNDYIQSVNILKSSYNLEYKEKKIQQNFYTFKLEQ